MGKPTLSVMIEYSSDLSEGRELGELKHLSTRRKRDLLGIPLVAASESGEAQTLDLSRGFRTVHKYSFSISERFGIDDHRE